MPWWISAEVHLLVVTRIKITQENNNNWINFFIPVLKYFSYNSVKCREINLSETIYKVLKSLTYWVLLQTVVYEIWITTFDLRIWNLLHQFLDIDLSLLYMAISKKRIRSHRQITYISSVDCIQHRIFREMKIICIGRNYIDHAKRTE